MSVLFTANWLYWSLEQQVSGWLWATKGAKVEQEQSVCRVSNCLFHPLFCHELFYIYLYLYVFIYNLLCISNITLFTLALSICGYHWELKNNKDNLCFSSILSNPVLELEVSGHQLSEVQLFGLHSHTFLLVIRHHCKHSKLHCTNRKLDTRQPQTTHN